MQIVRTTNASETYNLGQEIGNSLHGGDIIALSGELGSGKTTFTKGVAEALGITQEITSPTFLLVKQYQVSRPGINRLYHIDLYRLDEKADFRLLGLTDIFSDSQAVVIIEWPERLKNRLPEQSKVITFTYLAEDKREIVIK